jgi:flagellar M-ring protein FliF
VIVDGKYLEVAEVDAQGQPTGKAAKNYEPLAPEVISQVEGIVKSALGFDASRGDVVTVENVPFFAPDESLQAELAKAQQTDQYLKYGGMLVPVLTLLLFVLFVVRPLVKFLTSTSQQEYDLARLLPGQLLNADQPSSQEGAAQGENSVPPAGEQLQADGQRPGIPGLEPSINLEQYEEVVAENVRLVKENPQQAALLIRYWLNDGKI